MELCPACGAEVEAGVAACSACGARLEGATESFEAVGEREDSPYGDEFHACDAPVLIVLKGAEVGERFYLDLPEISIGRDPHSGIFLNDVTVSRRHAVVSVTDDEVVIADAGSLNGTYVNDVLVDRATLANGDSLQIGRFQMMFLCPPGGA